MNNGVITFKQEINIREPVNDKNPITLGYLNGLRKFYYLTNPEFIYNISGKSGHVRFNKRPTKISDDSDFVPEVTHKNISIKYQGFYVFSFGFTYVESDARIILQFY